MEKLQKHMWKGPSNVFFNKLFWEKFYQRQSLFNWCFKKELYPKLRLKSTASRGNTYHFHYADPEPNADRQNLELQTDGSTIWRSWVDGPSYSEKENLTALGTGFRCLQVHIIRTTKSPLHSGWAKSRKHSNHQQHNPWVPGHHTPQAIILKTAHFKKQERQILKLLSTTHSLTITFF